MRERPDDLRVAKTINAIHAAFEQMLCEMPYREITVKGLCERALVNKKTFYRYYETMDFLLAEFQDEMTAAYHERVAGLRIPEDLDAITRAFFEFAAGRGEVFERITCAGPHGALREQMIERVLSRHDGEAEPGDPERAILMAFVTESTLAMYRRWVADGKRIPLERMADLASRLVCDGAANRQPTSHRR